MGTEVRKFENIFQIVFFIIKPICFSSESIRDIVCKLKFPHGLHNTVTDLVASKSFPGDVKTWPTAIGEAPSKDEIVQSENIFKNLNYPNMYRYLCFKKTSEEVKIQSFY